MSSHRTTGILVWLTSLALVALVEAQTYTLESPTITIGAGVLPDKSILVIGQAVAGTVSNGQFTLEVGQVPCLLAALKGDFDEDFDVDAADLPVFVDVLLGVDTDPVHAAEADINGDGTANARDIRPFVAAMVSL